MVQACGGGVAPDVFGEFANAEAVACLGCGCIGKPCDDAHAMEARWTSCDQPFT